SNARNSAAKALSVLQTTPSSTSTSTPSAGSTIPSIGLSPAAMTILASTNPTGVDAAPATIPAAAPGNVAKARQAPPPLAPRVDARVQSPAPFARRIRDRVSSNVGRKPISPGLPYGPSDA